VAFIIGINQNEHTLMRKRSFKYHDFQTISEALDIAEDVTSNYYKFSFNQWKRHRYDVKTLISLNEPDSYQDIFAFLYKGSRISSIPATIPQNHDYYLICLQDHQILNALNRDKNICLLSLLIYIFIHELVHIVRFCNFSQRFKVSPKEKKREEIIVHSVTNDILSYQKISKLDYILDCYKPYRIVDWEE